MTGSVPIVRVDHVSKHFTVRKDKSLKERLVNFSRSQQHKETFEALKDINLEISSGSTVGLIGPNGSGKSTLLKVIGGIIQPSSGTVMRRGRMAALLELGAGFHPDLTGRENVFLNASILGLSERQTAQYFDEIVAFSGIEDFIDTQVKFYSSGMYVRLAFAVAVHVDPDLLLVDEVLAVGDEAFQKKCLDKIRSFQEEGRTIVLVTHTMNQITDLCTRAVLLSKGNAVYDGAPVDAVAMLRGGFTSQRQLAESRAAEAAAAAVKAPERPKPVSARGIFINGSEQATAETGDDITIDVHFDARERIEDWWMGLQISNSFGQMVLFTSTSRLEQTMAPADGRGSVRFLLPAAGIGGGEYTVSASMHSHREQGAEIARWQDAATFRIPAITRTVGPLVTEVTVAQPGR